MSEPDIPLFFVCVLSWSPLYCSPDGCDRHDKTINQRLRTVCTVDKPYWNRRYRLDGGALGILSSGPPAASFQREAVSRPSAHNSAIEGQQKNSCRFSSERSARILTLPIPLNVHFQARGDTRQRNRIPRRTTPAARGY